MSVVPHHGGMKQNIQETYAPFAIFRPGTHQPMRGKAQTFSAADIEQMAQNYNPKVHEAPLVLGHPEVDAPAYGWVESLDVVAGRLMATPRQISPGFAEMVNPGAYPKVSASFFRPTDTNNPMPGNWYLKHVGFFKSSNPWGEQAG